MFVCPVVFVLLLQQVAHTEGAAAALVTQRHDCAAFLPRQHHMQFITDPEGQEAPLQLHQMGAQLGRFLFFLRGGVRL